MGVSRDLNYGARWPVPEFVGLTAAQALALADETGIVLDGIAPGRVVRQEPATPQRDRPTRVTVWVET